MSIGSLLFISAVVVDGFLVVGLTLVLIFGLLRDFRDLFKKIW